MQTKRLNFLGSFFAAVFILSLAACAPVKPADPAYRWASGKWGTIPGMENADLRVINGNQLTGYFTYHSLSGNISDGNIQSGVVGRKNGVDFVEGTLLWSFGYTSTFRLDLNDNTLVGKLSHGELPGNDRFVAIKKAK